MFITMTSIVNKINGWEWLLTGLSSQLLYHQKHLTSTTESGLTDRYLLYFIIFTFYTFKANPIFEKLFFQVQNNIQQEVINNQIQKNSILEETIVKDATVPEQVAQEIIIDGRKITRISAGAYKGYLQESL